MIKLDIQSSKKNEKGIALLFTLIMLSMLLMLAMSFALDSMFAQKAAYNSASVSESVISSKAQFKQVLSLIQNNQDNYEYDADGCNPRLYSVDSSSLNYTYTDMLKEHLPVSGILEDTDETLKGSTPKVQWNYITSADGRITGRTAFVVVPDDKMPLDSLLDERNDSSDSNSPYYSIYPKHNEKYNTETRIGKYVSEINVRSVVADAVSHLGGDDNTKVNSMTDIMNWATDKPVTGAGFANGKYIGLWDNFDSFFATLDNTMGFNLLDTPEKADFKSNLSLAVSKDKEAFWADDGNTELDSTELYKRFNLNRNFDTANHTADLDFVRSNILLDGDHDPSDGVNDSQDGIPTESMEAWTDEDSNSASKGLPWLACFGYKDSGTGTWVQDDSLKGTFANVQYRRYQIAANLKDYCDTDNRPTSDISPTLSDSTNWTTSAPAFTGNERTPYIDKIGVKVTAWQDENSSNKLPSDFNTEPIAVVMNMLMPNIKKSKNGGYRDHDACSKYLAAAGYLTDDSYLIAKNDKGKDKGKKQYAVWAVVSISPTVGLINMYGSSWSEDLKVEISGTVNISTKVNGDPQENGIPFNTTIDVYSDEWSSGHSKFVSIALPEENFNGKTKVGKNSRSIDVNVIGLKINKVVLHNGTTAYDYTKTLSKDFTSSPVPVFSGDNSDTEDSKWFGFAVHDPRQNLNSDDWLALTTLDTSTSDPSTVFSLSGTGPYYGVANCLNTTDDGNNATDSPSVGGTEVDAEPSVTDPANGNISTAYIRNAPMESPWELGFVHRAVKWQTINLKTYDKTKAIQVHAIENSTGVTKKYYVIGGGSYSSGDANILDQIKMTEKAKSPQKISLKLRHKNTLDALFKKVRLGSVISRDTNFPVVAASHMSLESMAGINPVKAELSDADITTIRNGIISKYDNNPADEIRTRASVVDQLVGLNMTDAAAEELIGKIVNLTKISGNVDGFYVIVLAQSINDVGGTDGNSINIIRRSDNGDPGSMSCKIGQFDVYIDGSGDYKYNIYFDEITGEQKIFAYCVRGIDGKIKIQSFEYIE